VTEREIELRQKEQIIAEMLEGLDEDILAKLENRQDQGKELETVDEGENEGDRTVLEKMETEWLEQLDELDGQIPTPSSETTTPSKQSTHSSSSPLTRFTKPVHKSHTSPSPSKPLCLRCHEITNHSNPLAHQAPVLPPPRPISHTLTQIHTHNHDPLHPPLLIHVFDIVDFPLSFIPLDPPRGGKVLYVVNRADVLCERPGHLGRVRMYFKREIERILREQKGMFVEQGDRGGIGVEVHPVSALKGWGIKELLARMFQLRNAESNVYLIGIPLYPFQAPAVPLPLSLFHFPIFSL